MFDINHLEVMKIGNYEAKQVRFGLTNLNLESFNEGLKIDLELEDHSLIESNIAAVVKGDSHDKMIKFLKIFHSIGVTSEITLKIEKDAELEQMKEVTDNLCYLLSLARGTKIQWIYYNIHNEVGECFSRSHFANITKEYYDSPLIPDRDLRSFIEITYPNYLKKKYLYKLRLGLIDAYLEAIAGGSYLEIRGMRLSVIIEMIKDVIMMLPEAPVKETIFEKDYFKKIVYNPLKKILHDRLKNEIELGLNVENNDKKMMYSKILELNRRTFKEILIKICKFIKLEIDDNNIDHFINSRNSLIHKGLFFCQCNCEKTDMESKRMENVEEYFFLRDFVSKILLKILGYSGSYNSMNLIPGGLKIDKKELK